MTRIAVTGASGFIGSNLTVQLRERGFDVVPVGHELGPAQLHAALEGCGLVFHLAGVNRPVDERDFITGNQTVTEALLAALSAAEAPPPMVYASSVQATADNPYGRSKYAAERLVEAYGRRTGAPAAILRLPNIFGKWCRPNYNSVVATFCHNIARGLPITINDPSAPLRLLYIDDLVSHFIAIAQNPDDAVILTPDWPIYETTIGELASHLENFRDSRKTLVTERVGAGFLRALHATYVSYLEPSDFDYPLQAHTDPRGMFVEMLRTLDSGQFSFFTAHPGVTRGGHYHHSKTEKFLVVQGEARFGFRHIVTGETLEILTSGATPRMVETVPGWSHDITNIGEQTMLVMLWANEVFDPQRPDTIAAKVETA